MGSTESGEVLDGRTARAVRTRDSLIDATMALIEEGDLRPTAPRIAERAGVSVRSVFQHFDDLETLFSELGDRTFARLRSMVEPIDTSAPLWQRVEAFVTQRCMINEALSPINRAAALQMPTSEAIRLQFERGHALSTAHLRVVFAPELALLGDNDEPLFHALRFATSWSTWNMCRVIEGRSVADSTTAVRRVLELAFEGAGLKATP